MKIVLAALTLAFACTTDAQLSRREATALFNTFEFVMVSNKPGAAIAFRLKKNHLQSTVHICFRQECLTASKQWQLLATDASVPQKQYVMLEDADRRFALRRIALESGLSRQAQNKSSRKIANLRLPASVIEQLNAESAQIVTDQTGDRHLFTRSTRQPWSSQWALPINSAVTSEFGSWRLPANGQAYSHTGADLRAALGTKIFAASDGVVIQAEDHVVEGRVVTIDHGSGLMSRYAHLSAFKVKPGDLVKAGDLIGLSGSSGRSEAPHLHFEMRIRGLPVDPLSTQRLMARLSYLE